ncbi:signal peptidase I [Frondihabitans australicus]|uniref:signal peptidase I n=1 Tax=Frondihabitans australicus TaxID=386892 RepID=UPI001475FA6B|nr:signal peptidase I [Frondihabitans australicus]
MADPPRGHRVQTLLIWAGASLVTALVVLALVFHAQGGRWFIVETPSMGTTAPVGTLVLSTPVKAQDLRVGDIITFHPPTEPSSVYTHRIAAIDASGISTRGDINGADDGWKLHQKDLIGETTTILPAVGWLVRGLPILGVGFAFVMFATRLIANRARRQSFRILGFSMLLSVTVYVLRPFVGLVVLTTQATKAGVSATIVSTGILPITATAQGGSSVNLSAGQVGTVTVPASVGSGHYALSSALHLTLLEWILFGAICAIPLLWTLIVGLPSTPDEESAA